MTRGCLGGPAVIIRSECEAICNARFGGAGGDGRYEMDYVRSVGGVRRGHRVLQVAFGSGFKCNSAVWLALNHGSSMPRSESAVAYAAENNKDKNQ